MSSGTVGAFVAGLGLRFRSAARRLAAGAHPVQPGDHGRQAGADLDGEEHLVLGREADHAAHEELVGFRVEAVQVGDAKLKAALDHLGAVGNAEGLVELRPAGDAVMIPDGGLKLPLSV